MIASTMQGMNNIYKKRVFAKAAFLLIFIMGKIMKLLIMQFLQPTVTFRLFSLKYSSQPVEYPGIFFGGGVLPRNSFCGCSTNSVEDREQRERGSGGGSPLVRGSGGSYNLVQEISFHTVTFS
jgi:hypothetical protein